MTINHNHDDDASSIKRIKTCENDGVAPWSDLTHDVLSLVMMQLEVVDFIAFNRVCKSWRSLAKSNRNKFIVSRPPMSISISFNDANEKEWYLEDFEGRKLKTILPHLVGREYIGVTCGYLILFGEKTSDFWLVNPITRHELHFPYVPFVDLGINGKFRAILVFSPSVSGWVFVISNPFRPKIWFSVAGKGEWTHLPTPLRILDLQAFKGKIYALDFDHQLSEVGLYPTPKVTLIEIKNFPKPNSFFPLFLSLGENLYLWDLQSSHRYKIYEIDFGEMKCMSRNNIVEEYVFFGSSLKYSVSCDDLQSKYRKRFVTIIGDTRGGWTFSYAEMWYFFHNCLNVNILHE